MKKIRLFDSRVTFSDEVWDFVDPLIEMFQEDTYTDVELQIPRLYFFFFYYSRERGVKQ